MKKVEHVKDTPVKKNTRKKKLTDSVLVRSPNPAEKSGTGRPPLSGSRTRNKLPHHRPHFKEIRSPLRQPGFGNNVVVPSLHVGGGNSGLIAGGDGRIGNAIYNPPSSPAGFHQQPPSPGFHQQAVIRPPSPAGFHQQPPSPGFHQQAAIRPPSPGFQQSQYGLNNPAASLVPNYFGNYFGMPSSNNGASAFGGANDQNQAFPPSSPGFHQNPAIPPSSRAKNPPASPVPNYFGGMSSSNNLGEQNNGANGGANISPGGAPKWRDNVPLPLFPTSRVSQFRFFFPFRHVDDNVELQFLTISVLSNYP